jgi:hypothetical protein
MFTSRLWVLVALVALSVACSFHAESRKPTTGVVETRPAHEGASPAAMRAYRDPITGRFGPPPAPPAGAPAAAVAAPLGTTGLVEVPTPYGGTLVDLKGRFASHVVATAHPDGSRATCVDGAQ